MKQPPTFDDLDEIQRKLAFAEACANPLEFEGLLSRTSGLLFKWAQADAVVMIRPSVVEGETPVVHVVGRQPLMHYAERSLRGHCAELLGRLDFARILPHELNMQRGPELMPLHGIMRDDPMHCMWFQPMVADDEVVGILALFGFTDWILSRRLRRLLGALVTPLARAVSVSDEVDLIRARASTDSLTGAFNRRGFNEAMLREVARAERTGGRLALVLLDLDHFKRINDEYGHPEGDAVLRGISARLAGELRCTDILSRWGGDEFAVLLPDADLSTAQDVARRLVRAGAELRHTGGGAISLSAGVSIYQVGGEDSVQQMLEGADESLYSAKQGGRGRIGLVG